MSFREYMHVSKFGNDEVLDIELGECYVFPKLDGTNASLWLHCYDTQDGIYSLGAGSRTRHLSMESDNAGFFAAQAAEWAKWGPFFAKHPTYRLYGEWLVPHTLTTYREDAWKKFYVFDVYDDYTKQYLPYSKYKPLLDEFNILHLPPIAIIKNGSYESFINTLNQNVFYIQDGKGVGEGIVIKNYDYYNRFGHQVWAKMVTSEFKEKHSHAMGPPETEKQLTEELIAKETVTKALCEKTLAKIKLDKGGWSNTYIKELLGRIYHDVVTEELWDQLVKLRNPTVSFRTLEAFVIRQVKEQLKDEVF